MRIFRNIKPQNRLRVVYWVEDGEPISYIHIEDSEAKTFLNILREIRKHDDWVLQTVLAKKLGMPRVTLTWALSKMAGARAVEARKNGTYHRLLKGPLILLRKEIIHGNVRRGLERPYKSPPIYVMKGPG